MAERLVLADDKSEVTSERKLLLLRVKSYAKVFMDQYDGSHDFAHVERVLAIALKIAASSSKLCDPHIVALSALLHDVGDRKYIQPGNDPDTMVQKLLLSYGADEELARKVQVIVSAVSFTNEINNPTLVKELVIKHPELGAVQDADRLDAIGAIGIGRLFTFGGAHSGRALCDSMKLFDVKLEKQEGMMKTDIGKIMAKERTKRLKTFKEWWATEQEESRMALERFQTCGDL